MVQINNQPLLVLVQQLLDLLLVHIVAKLALIAQYVGPDKVLEDSDSLGKNLILIVHSKEISADSRWLGLSALFGPFTQTVSLAAAKYHGCRNW